MNNMEQEILCRYRAFTGRRTVRGIAEDIGVGASRIYRIMQGCEMTLREYQRLWEKIYQSQEELRALISSNQKGGMMKGILVVERIILESISAGNGTLEEVCEDTGLEERIVGNILLGLEDRGLLELDFKRGGYVIDESARSKWPATLNQKENVKEEIKDLFIALINHYFEEEKEGVRAVMRVQKIKFTQLEERMFKVLLHNLESFLETVKQENAKRVQGKLKEHSIVFWGISDYGSTVERAI